MNARSENRAERSERIPESAVGPFCKAIRWYELIQPHDKIALGHHFDDVIGTTVMGMFYGGQLQGMMRGLEIQGKEVFLSGSV